MVVTLAALFCIGFAAILYPSFVTISQNRFSVIVSIVGFVFVFVTALGIVLPQNPGHLLTDYVLPMSIFATAIGIEIFFIVWFLRKKIPSNWLLFIPAFCLFFLIAAFFTFLITLTVYDFS